MMMATATTTTLQEPYHSTCHRHVLLKLTTPISTVKPARFNKLMKFLDLDVIKNFFKPTATVCIIAEIVGWITADNEH